MTSLDDISAWKLVRPDDLWIFDKLILSKKLGYTCGPKGVPVPRPGRYVIRPCVNVMGMGRGAYIADLQDSTESIPDGTFWCEEFLGDHLSVDYYQGKQVLAVKGVRSGRNLDRWDRWEKVSLLRPIPKIAEVLVERYNWLNVEYIGDKVIEIHLRYNPDFSFLNVPYIIPAYDSSELEGHTFIPWPEHNRIGFFVPNK